MSFNFSKEFIGTYHDEGCGKLEESRMYTVYNKEKLVGQFIYNAKVCFFAYAAEEFRIDIKPGFFRRTKCTIVNQRTKADIGKYIVSDCLGNLIENGKFISRENEMYTCKELKRKVGYSLFKKYTHVYYEIEFGNAIDKVIFRFKIEGIKQFSFGLINERFLSFKGGIELKGENALLIFAGLFLLEMYFEYLDESSMF